MNDPSDESHLPDTLRATIQLIRTNSKFVQQAYQTFRRHGLTAPQFDVLAALHRRDGLMQQDLASSMLVSKGNITGIVGRMEALGWIERRPDPHDHRSNRVYLTGLGREVFARIAPERRAAGDAVMVDFDPDEVRTLIYLLAKLESGIDKMNKDKK